MTTLNDIKQAAINTGYYGSLSASQQAAFDLNPTGFIAQHPFIQTAYPILWNTYVNYGGSPIPGLVLIDANTIQPSNPYQTPSTSNVPGTGSFEQLYPKQTQQLIDLGNAESDIWKNLQPFEQYVNNFKQSYDTTLVSLGKSITDSSTANSNTASYLNREVTYINTKFADIDAKLSSLGSSVSTVSNATNPLSSITNFLKNPLGLGTIGIVIIAVIVIFLLKR